MDHRRPGRHPHCDRECAPPLSFARPARPSRFVQTERVIKIRIEKYDGFGLDRLLLDLALIGCLRRWYSRTRGSNPTSLFNSTNAFSTMVSSRSMPTPLESEKRAAIKALAAVNPAAAAWYALAEGGA
eukprot:5707793-Prymnesium_polylepis.1